MSGAGTFTGKYGVTKLVYYEIYEDPFTAITREKQIKGWLRSRKIALISSANPAFNELPVD
jgi:putative endonuclease